MAQLEHAQCWNWVLDKGRGGTKQDSSATLRKRTIVFVAQETQLSVLSGFVWIAGEQFDGRAYVEQLERLLAESCAMRTQLEHRPQITLTHSVWVLYLVGTGRRIGFCGDCPSD